MIFAAKILNLTFLPVLAFVVLSVHEVCGAKSLISSSPEDPENSISSSSNAGNKLGSDVRHSYHTTNSGGGKRYATQASQSIMNPAPPPPSSYSNLNSGYFGLGGYNSYPTSNSYRYNNYLHGNSNPIIADPYERTARDYNPSSMANAYQLSPASGNSFIDSIVPDYMASASNSGGGSFSNNGGGGGGGGGGGSKSGGGSHHGYGWSHGHQSVSNNNTGLGLLGLLGLLSLLQGVLQALATTAATTAAPAGGRKKRGLQPNSGRRSSISSDHITSLVLPYLNVVAHARQGTISINCTQRQVCFVNKILNERLGTDSGSMIGQKMSDAMKSLLLERAVDKIQSSTENVVNFIEKASNDGRAGLNCDILYPHCLEMKHQNGTIVHPPLLLAANVV